MKKIIKKLIPFKLRAKLRFILNSLDKNKSYSKKDKIIYLLRNFFKYQIYHNKKEFLALKKLYKKIHFKSEKGFVYFIDERKILINKEPNYWNGTVDYEILLKYSLEELSEKTVNINMQLLYKTMIDIIKNNYKNETNRTIYDQYVINIIDHKPQSLAEALQRILFLNQIMWQTNHKLVGLGRLDLILEPFIQKETNEDIKDLLKDFYYKLHYNYKFKSSSLYGDTGQIIILGGYINKNKTFENKLTHHFIEVLEEIKIPEPKVLLRVNKLTSRMLIEKSLKCIKTGIGCPLFANDDIIIPAMKNFGYTTEDAINYITAACWEPFPANNAVENNNFWSLNFLKLFNDLLDHEDLEKFNSLEDILNTYDRYLTNCFKEINKATLNYHIKDLLASCFKFSCIESKKTISQGGTKYSYFGVTGVGLANVIDSLINIEYLVFREKKTTLKSLKKALEDNLEDANLLRILKEENLKYGMDDYFVVELTNSIIKRITNVKKDYPTIKFGLSSPDYISGNVNVKASLDGRQNGDPSNVHISCSKSIAFTELFSFASQLEYSNGCINGNVVDFYTNAGFVEKHFDQFVDLLLGAFEQGIFEMQMNVVDSATLIAAKNNPNLYPNLIVRVWGFSAYFNELPMEYKNLIIERAIRSETVN